MKDTQSKEYLPNEFGSDYMPSRIDWIVQSSGVDYPDMLIVSMEYRYYIRVRYPISVHDELRYPVKEEDKYAPRWHCKSQCGREQSVWTIYSRASRFLRR